MTAPARAGDEARKNEARKKALEILDCFSDSQTPKVYLKRIAARIAPILAERDAAIERAEKAEVDEVLAEMRAKALETNLGIARQRCDAAIEELNRLKASI